jgi:hypothetical protein
MVERHIKNLCDLDHAIQPVIHIHHAPPLSMLRACGNGYATMTRGCHKFTNSVFCA